MELDSKMEKRPDAAELVRKNIISKDAADHYKDAMTMSQIKQSATDFRANLHSTKV